MPFIARQGAGVVLLDAGSATGDFIPIGQGTFLWAVSGTWDSASATLEISLDGGVTAIALDLDALTDDGGATPIELPACHVRVAIGSAGGSTELFSELRPAG